MGSLISIHIDGIRRGDVVVSQVFATDKYYLETKDGIVISDDMSKEDADKLLNWIDNYFNEFMFSCIKRGYEI